MQEVTPQVVLDCFGIKFDFLQKSLYDAFWNRWNEEDAIGYVQQYSKRCRAEDVIIGDSKFCDEMNTKSLQKFIKNWEKSIDFKDAFKIAWIRFWKRRACGGIGRHRRLKISRP